MTYTGVLDLDSLSTGIPAINPSLAAVYKESCMVCLDNQDHESGVLLSVDYMGNNQNLRVDWRGQVDDNLRRVYGDLTRTTENAAVGVALLLVREITTYTAIRPAVRGTTVDYFLGSKGLDETLIFNDSARLEVSGILRESPDNSVGRRVKDKKRRLSTGLAALIAVVEFGSPKSKMVKS